MKTIYILIFLLLIVVFGIFIIKYRETTTIPRIIWTYWDEEVENMPQFIKKCISTWHTENKNYKIIIITNNNLERYVGKEEARDILNCKLNDTSQRMSDSVRLSVLSKHGGIWLDASIVCYENLDWIHQLNTTKCIVYSIPELSIEPVIESWFIACTKNNDFINKWNREFRRVAEYENVSEYIKDINIDLSGIDYPDYLLIYVCARKIYRENPNSLHILNATTGPYNYHAKGGIHTLCNRTKQKLIKFRKEDRAAILKSENLEHCIFDKNIDSI